MQVCRQIGLVDGEEATFLGVCATEDWDASDVTGETALRWIADECHVVDYRGGDERVGVDDGLDGACVRGSDAGQVTCMRAWAAELGGYIVPSDGAVSIWHRAVCILAAL